MSRTTPVRQRWRRALLLVSFFAFPITMNYFSPYLIVDSAFKGIVNGSFAAFGTMLIGSLVLGRLWCGWACPMGGLQEFALPVNERRLGPRADIAKWVIWVPWVALVAFGAMTAGGYRAVDLLVGTQGGISVAGSADRPILIAYIMYFGVVALFFGLAVGLGRRAGCHALCWMAPFMVLGRRASNLANTPALRLRADADACHECGRCTDACPMGLDVQGMVTSRSMEHYECVLCGTCADTCPHKVIRFGFGRAR